MIKLTHQQVNLIFDLMRMDSNNFNDLVSQDLHSAIHRVYGLHSEEINFIEEKFRVAFRDIYQAIG